jgi:hypothetical protein
MNSYKNKKRKRNLVKKVKRKSDLNYLKFLARIKYWKSLTPEQKRDKLFPPLPTQDFLDFISEFPEIEVDNKEFFEWKKVRATV